MGFWGLEAVLGRLLGGFFSAFGRGEMLAFFFGGQFFPPSGALCWLSEFGTCCVLGLVPELDLVVPQPRSQDPDLRFLRTDLVREGFRRSDPLLRSASGASTLGVPPPWNAGSSTVPLRRTHSPLVSGEALCGSRRISTPCAHPRIQWGGLVFWARGEGRCTLARNYCTAACCNLLHDN